MKYIKRKLKLYSKIIIFNMASIREDFNNLEDNINSFKKKLDEINEKCLNEFKASMQKELENFEKNVKSLEKKVNEMEEDRLQREFSEAAKKYSEIVFSGGV